MSLRDMLRGRRNDEAGRDDSGAKYDESIGTESTWDNALSGTVELTEFAPRQDGDYHCAERGLYLRFARPIVTETATHTAIGTAAGSTGNHPARGEFTTSGRFTVQRPFGRPIVYTVLGDGAGGTSRSRGNDAILAVRRTDTETRAAERLEFVFEPDET
jgi:hypothetical protein